MNRWGTLFIKRLISEKNSREAIKKRKKDGYWQNDSVEYARCQAKAEKLMTEPIVVSQLNPICPQCTDTTKRCGFYENNLQKTRENQENL